MPLMMQDLELTRDYCEEHLDTCHFIDERGACYGDSLAAVESQGYHYTGHAGRVILFTVDESAAARVD